MMKPFCQCHRVTLIAGCLFAISTCKDVKIPNLGIHGSSAEVAEEREVEEPLPAELLLKLEAEAVTEGGRAYGLVYNGTEWVITGVDFLATDKEKSQDRQFRLSCRIEPFAVARPQWDPGGFMRDVSKEGQSYKILSARGYKPKE